MFEQHCNFLFHIEICRYLLSDRHTSFRRCTLRFPFSFSLLEANFDTYIIELQIFRLRDGLPISSDRYRLSMRDNIVQLALKQTRKNDAGYYSLVATRLGQEKDKALKKIHLSVSEPSYEEGDPPIFLRRLSDLAVKVGTRTRFLVEIRSSTTLKV